MIYVSELNIQTFKRKQNQMSNTIKIQNEIKNELKSLNLLQLKTKQRQAKSKGDLLLKFSEGPEAMEHACDVLRFTSLEIRNRERKFND